MSHPRIKIRVQVWLEENWLKVVIIAALVVVAIIIDELR